MTPLDRPVWCAPIRGSASSTHKLAGSLTQASMLHLGEGPFADVLEPLIDRAYTMTASTSGGVTRFIWATIEPMPM